MHMCRYHTIYTLYVCIYLYIILCIYLKGNRIRWDSKGERISGREELANFQKEEEYELGSENSISKDEGPGREDA